MPEDPISLIVDAPEERQVMIHVSQEKGIRFMFPIGKVGHLYRERFLQAALVDFSATILALQFTQAAKDELTDPNGSDWFVFMSRVIAQREQAGEKINAIGGGL